MPWETAAYRQSMSKQCGDVATASSRTCVQHRPSKRGITHRRNFWVGRGAARSKLELALRRARSGEMQMHFSPGKQESVRPPWRRTSRKRRRRMVLRWSAGYCRPGSGETDAYYPILEMLLALSRGPMRARLAAVLAEYAPTWLVQLPSLMPDKARELLNEVIGATPHRMARELCDALDAFARDRLLLLVIEDIHWADQATLDMIQGARQSPASHTVVDNRHTSVPRPNRGGVRCWRPCAKAPTLSRGSGNQATASERGRCRDLPWPARARRTASRAHPVPLCAQRGQSSVPEGDVGSTGPPQAHFLGRGRLAPR